MNLENRIDLRRQLFPEVKKQFVDFDNLMVENRYWSKLHGNIMIFSATIKTQIEHKLTEYEFICNKMQTASR